MLSWLASHKFTHLWFFLDGKKAPRSIVGLFSCLVIMLATRANRGVNRGEPYTGNRDVFSRLSRAAFLG